MLMSGDEMGRPTQTMDSADTVMKKQSLGAVSINTCSPT